MTYWGKKANIEEKIYKVFYYEHHIGNIEYSFFTCPRIYFVGYFSMHHPLQT